MATLCRLRLGELAPSDIENLVRFTEDLLVSKGTSGTGAPDLIQRVFVSVLNEFRHGDEQSNRSGNRQLVANLTSGDAFLRCMRSAIKAQMREVTRIEGSS